jgi:hypothetical protein
MDDQYAARNSSRDPENPEEEGKTSPEKAEKTKNLILMCI